MAAVLHLHPIRRPASAIGPISAFRYQALQPHVAGRPKQVWTDLAHFKWRNENAVGTPCQQPREVRLPHRERKRAHVVAVTGEHIEGVKLDLLVVLAGMQRVEIETPSTPRMTASPSMTNCFIRFFSANSTIQGNSWSNRSHSESSAAPCRRRDERAADIHHISARESNQDSTNLGGAGGDARLEHKLTHGAKIGWPNPESNEPPICCRKSSAWRETSEVRQITLTVQPARFFIEGQRGNCKCSQS